MPRLRVDLMKMRFLALRRRRKKLDRTGHERQAEISLPIGTRHGLILMHCKLMRELWASPAVPGAERRPTQMRRIAAQQCRWLTAPNSIEPDTRVLAGPLIQEPGAALRRLSAEQSGNGLWPKSP